MARLGSPVQRGGRAPFRAVLVEPHDRIQVPVSRRLVHGIRRACAAARVVQHLQDADMAAQRCPVHRTVPAELLVPPDGQPVGEHGPLQPAHAARDDRMPAQCNRPPVLQTEPRHVPGELAQLVHMGNRVAASIADDVCVHVAVGDRQRSGSSVGEVGEPAQRRSYMDCERAPSSRLRRKPGPANGRSAAGPGRLASRCSAPRPTAPQCPRLRGRRRRHSRRRPERRTGSA
ncbi:hypothetical protein BC831DRAFT_293216 [Entophlyctis helioformis]|nr:hypothetical protein BC831DRAFT_293216 [Entophlyctis helioformis]